MPSGSCSTSGNLSGGTGNTRSQERWSTSRLVASTFRRGQTPRSSATLWRGFYDLLEVIHEQQQFPLFQELSQTLGEGLLSQFPEP